MQKLKRRIYTTVISVLASVVVLAAVISGLFRGAMLLAPEYRDELASWVSQLAERPISIASMDLTWRGLHPSLDLHGVVLFDPESGVAALRAETMRLGIGLDRVLSADWRPDRIELAGLTLNLIRTDDGGLSVRGLGIESQDPSTPGVAPAQIVAELGRFSLIRFERCTLVVEAGVLSERTVAVALDEISAQRQFGGFAINAQARLPESFGGATEFHLDVNGDPTQMASWDGRWELSSERLNPGPWLQRWLKPYADISARALNLKLRGEIGAGALSEVSLDLRADQISGVSKGQLLQQFDDLVLVAYLDLALNQWRLELRKFGIGGLQAWDIGRANAEYQQLAGGGYSLSADAGALRLQLLSPWLQLFEGLPIALQQLRALEGDLLEPVLRLRQDADQPLRVAYRARLDRLLLETTKTRVAGISGELAGSETEGRLSLRPSAVLLEFPERFAQPIALDELAGELRWRRNDSGWNLHAQSLLARGMGTELRGEVRLGLPQDEPVYLYTDATLKAADVNQLKGLMPLKWSDGLRGWLQDSLLAARVLDGRLRLDGEIGRFETDAEPGPGVFELDLEVADARLSFAPRWPEVDRLAASVKFRGRELTVAAHQGRSAGVAFDRVVARIPDLATGLLEVDAEANQNASRYYAYLAASPLSKPLSELLAHTSINGPAKLDVHVDVPLKDVASTQASGRVRLRGVALKYDGLQRPIENIHGDLRFNGPQVRAEGLTADFYGQALSASLSPTDDGALGLHAALTVPYSENTELAQTYLPPWLLARLNGSAQWQANIAFGGDAAPVLLLNSNMRGVRADLPAPLAKAADAAVPLSLRVTAAAGDTRIQLSYADRLELALRLADGGARLGGAQLHFGAQAPPDEKLEGVHISGQLAQVELEQWLPLLGEMTAGDGGGELRGADLGIGQLRSGSYSVRDLRVTLSPDGERWAVSLDGEGAQGHVLWPRQMSGEVLARLERLQLDYEPRDGPGADEVLDPSALPVLDLQVGRLQVNRSRFGELQLRSARIADGQRLAQLTLDGGDMQASASGQWWRTDDRSGAELAFDLQSPAIAQVLASLGYAKTLQANSSRFVGDLRWSPSAEGIDWAQARGKIRLQVDNGTLQAVEPGAGRVLGLVNFYALPRRLTLNFRDVLGEGLAFDSIGGEFQLGDGQAVTQDLSIDAPSLRMETRGRIGLADKDYDQRVTVYPDVSAGVTLASALLGGPALGALMLIAQEILDKPLDQATQLSYHLGGTWDNPKVTKLGGN